MVKVVESDCIGCGLCVNICPNVFKFNDDGKSEVVSNDIENFRSELEECIKMCPTGAIEEE